MKRLIGLILVVLLLSAVPVLAAPKVVVEQFHYNFGEVTQGQEVEFTFRFRNAGDQILELGSVRTSCGCTAALLSTRRLAPGDSGELTARFDSGHFQGPISKSITMETNDPHHRQVVFSMSGTIRVELVLNPRELFWKQVAVGKELEGVVTIQNRGKTLVNLQPPQTTNPDLTAELDQQQLPPNGQVKLRVRGKLKPGMARLSGYVIIATDYKNVPQLRVTVRARLSK